MKLGCQQCGTYSAHEPCSDCGKIVHIGEWPKCPHGKPSLSKGLEPFFDFGLGKTITTMGDINAACRPHWEGDNIVHIQPTGKSDSYYKQLNERRAEKANAERRERGR